MVLKFSLFYKTSITYPLIPKFAFAYQGVKNSFFGKFCVHTKWMIPCAVQVEAYPPPLSTFLTYSSSGFSLFAGCLNFKT